MAHELIRTWLNLPSDRWPPDHYTLLGLQPGSNDVTAIEEEVHRRLDTVRGYQLTHPDQATEAMNRLAQALVCLTDPAAKREYDAQLFGKPAEPRPAVTVKPPKPSSVVITPPESPPLPPVEPAFLATARTQLDLADTARPEPPTVETRANGTTPEVVPVAPDRPPRIPPPPPPTSERIDPAAEAGRASLPARRGIGTKRALYQRIVRTRQLLAAWEQAGKYIAWPKRRLTRPAEATELIRLLSTVRTQIEDFPRMLGEAGQPGYLVLALARQAAVVPTFQELLPSQREALARDWWAGRTLLQAHRAFLRDEVKTMRRASPWRWFMRASSALMFDQPGKLLLLLGLVALNIAIWRTFFSPDWLPSFSRPTPKQSGTERE